MPNSTVTKSLKYNAAFSMLSYNFISILDDQQLLLSSGSIRQACASSITAFLTSAETYLLNTGTFNILTPETVFSFLLWATALLYCIISALRFAIFLLHSLHKGYTTPAASGFANHAKSIGHSL